MKVSAATAGFFFVFLFFLHPSAAKCARLSSGLAPWMGALGHMRSASPGFVITAQTTATDLL